MAVYSPPNPEVGRLAALIEARQSRRSVRDIISRRRQGWHDMKVAILQGTPPTGYGYGSGSGSGSGYDDD